MKAFIDAYAFKLYCTHISIGVKHWFGILVKWKKLSLKE